MTQRIENPEANQVAKDSGAGEGESNVYRDAYKDVQDSASTFRDQVESSTTKLVDDKILSPVSISESANGDTTNDVLDFSAGGDDIYKGLNPANLDKSGSEAGADISNPRSRDSVKGKGELSPVDDSEGGSKIPVDKVPGPTKPSLDGPVVPKPEPTDGSETDYQNQAEKVPGREIPGQDDPGAPKGSPENPMLNDAEASAQSIKHERTMDKPSKEKDVAGKSISHEMGETDLSALNDLSDSEQAAQLKEDLSNLNKTADGLSGNMNPAQGDNLENSEPMQNGIPEGAEEIEGRLEPVDESEIDPDATKLPEKDVTAGKGHGGPKDWSGLQHKNSADADGKVNESQPTPAREPGLKGDAVAIDNSGRAERKPEDYETGLNETEATGLKSDSVNDTNLENAQTQKPSEVFKNFVEENIEDAEVKEALYGFMRSFEEKI